MRIAVCGIKTVPSNEGGIERGVEELNTRLTSLGYHVTLFCRAERTGETDYKELAVRNVGYTKSKYLCYFTYMYRVVLQLLSEPRQFDVVHVHTPSMNGFWILVLRLAGYRTVAHSHGLEWMARKWPFWFRPVMRTLEFIGAVAAHQIVTVSRVEQRHFARIPGKGSVMHILNGLPSAPVGSDGRLLRELCIEQGGFYLFVGRIVPQKCVLELVDAFALTKSAKKLLIVGGSSFTDDYERRVRIRAAKDYRINLVGWLPRTDVFALCRTCFAFVLPSDHEGCPNALLEAIACGSPCLVTDIPAHREIMSPSFPVIDVHDAKRFAEALALLESSPTTYSACKKGVEAVQQSLPTWDDVAQHFHEVYRSLFKVRAKRTDAQERESLQ